MSAPPGSAGYAEIAAIMLERRVPFEVAHRPLLPLLPAIPIDVLDLGAGPGHDAAALAKMGDRVVAVEPIAALREGGRALYGDASINWCDACLPLLEGIDGRYDLIIASGVWHHLDRDERAIAMTRIVSLLADRGLFAVSMRHGPVQHGRRGFMVSAEEAIALAAVAGLTTIVQVTHDSILAANRAAGVTWTYLVFRG